MVTNSLFNQMPAGDKHFRFQCLDDAGVAVELSFTLKWRPDLNVVHTSSEISCKPPDRWRCNNERSYMLAQVDSGKKAFKLEHGPTARPQITPGGPNEMLVSSVSSLICAYSCMLKQHSIATIHTSKVAGHFVTSRLNSG